MERLSRWRPVDVFVHGSKKLLDGGSVIKIHLNAQIWKRVCPVLGSLYIFWKSVKSEKLGKRFNIKNYIYIYTNYIDLCSFHGFVCVHKLWKRVWTSSGILDFKLEQIKLASLRGGYPTCQQRCWRSHTLIYMVELPFSTDPNSGTTKTKHMHWHKDLWNIKQYPAFKTSHQATQPVTPVRQAAPWPLDVRANVVEHLVVKVAE